MLRESNQFASHVKSELKMANELVLHFFFFIFKLTTGYVETRYTPFAFFASSDSETLCPAVLLIAASIIPASDR